MADTIVTVKSAGGDYASLDSAIAAIPSSIAGGDRYIIDCYAFQDTGRVSQDSSAKTVTGELIIRAIGANQHGGAWGAGYRLDYSSGAAPITWTLPTGAGRVIFDGIQVNMTGAAAAVAPNGVFPASVEFHNCMFRAPVSPLYTLISASGAATNKIICTNCIFIADSAGYGVEFYGGNSTNGTDVWMYNCVVVNVGNTHGFRVGYYHNNCYIKNCYIVAGSTALYTTSSATPVFTTCAHSSSESVTGSTGNVAYSTTNFTSVTSGSENFTLPATATSLIDAGTSLAADSTYPFSTDIIGTTRSGTWEIGPYNYTSEVVPTLMGQQWT